MLKEELDCMTQIKVVEKVTKPTDWVNSIVVVEKPNGKLRICLDPRNLNKVIKRSHYPIPTMEEIRSKLNKSCVYSTLDANSGFWMLSLDEVSSNLFVFNTPFGSYKFLKLPYGINSAPEIFHRVKSEHFGELPGTLVYIDDILVYGENEKEHNEIWKEF